MNMMFRLLYFLLFNRNRQNLALLDKAMTPFRVWLTDLDILMHMNNGKYLSLMDLGRLDLLQRCGAARALDKEGIFPVLAAETITFRKSLKLLNKFFIQTQVLGWDEKYFYLEQSFIRNGDLYARALVKARMLKKSGDKIAPATCLNLFGASLASPVLPDYLQAWLQTLT